MGEQKGMVYEICMYSNFRFYPSDSHRLYYDFDTCDGHLDHSDVTKLISFLEDVRSKLTPLYEIDNKKYTKEELTQHYLKVKGMLENANSLPQ